MPNTIFSLFMAVLLNICTVGTPTLVKREYFVWKNATDYDNAVKLCARDQGHLLDLRISYRRSVDHQLKPFYDSGNLLSTDFLWIGLRRESQNLSLPFKWFDGEELFEQNFTLGSSYKFKAFEFDDAESCVALKYSSTQEDMIVRREDCSKSCLPFCEYQSTVEQACDYEQIGPVEAIPITAPYAAVERSGISNRTSCENQCTSVDDEDSINACWMYSYSRDSQSCRLITGERQPQWEQTCDWFVYNSSWETRKRNCFEVHVYNETEHEIILGPCVLPTPTFLIEEMSSTPILPSSSFLEDASFSATVAFQTTTVAPEDPEISSSYQILTSIADVSSFDTPMSSFVTEEIPPSSYAEDWMSSPVRVELVPSTLEDVSTSVGLDTTSEYASLSSTDMSTPAMEAPVTSSGVLLTSSIPVSSPDYVAETTLLTTSAVDEIMSSPDYTLIASSILTSVTHISLSSSDYVVETSAVDEIMSSPDNRILTSSFPAVLDSVSLQSTPISDPSSYRFPDYSTSGNALATSVISDTISQSIDQSDIFVATSITEQPTISSAVIEEVAETSTGSFSSTSYPGYSVGLCEMPCPCNQSRLKIKNYTFIEQILQSLTINPKNTSAYKRQFTSAPDERPLSVGLGWSGAALLIFTGCGIFILDCRRLFQDILMLLSNMKDILNPGKHK